MEKKIIGRCPLCGGNVVKTCKGYRCENNIAEQPTCVLNINGIIGNRKMSDEESPNCWSTASSCWTASLPRRERLSLPCWNWQTTVPSTCSLSSANARIVAAIFGWVREPSTAPITATSRRRATLPSGATLAATS